MAGPVACPENDYRAEFAVPEPCKQIESRLIVSIRHRSAVNQAIEQFGGGLCRPGTQDKYSTGEFPVMEQVGILDGRKVFQLCGNAFICPCTRTTSSCVVSMPATAHPAIKTAQPAVIVKTSTDRNSLNFRPDFFLFPAIASSVSGRLFPSRMTVCDALAFSSILSGFPGYVKGWGGNLFPVPLLRQKGDGFAQKPSPFCMSGVLSRNKPVDPIWFFCPCQSAISSILRWKLSRRGPWW